MLQNLTGWHALIVLSLGQSVRILRTEVGDERRATDEETTETAR